MRPLSTGPLRGILREGNPGYTLVDVSRLRGGSCMAKLTLSEAARACHIARTTIQRAVRAGRLSLDAEHLVDTAELLRVGYQVDAAVLHAAPQQVPSPMQQYAAPPRS